MQAALGSFDSFEEENEKFSFAKQDGESFYLFFNKLQTNTTSVHLQLYLLGRFTVLWVCLAPNHLAPPKENEMGKQVNCWHYRRNKRVLNPSIACARNISFSIPNVWVRGDISIDNYSDCTKYSRAMSLHSIWNMHKAADGWWRRSEGGEGKLLRIDLYDNFPLLRHRLGANRNFTCSLKVNKLFTRMRFNLLTAKQLLMKENDGRK
jgi:hypothetical protein